MDRNLMLVDAHCHFIAPDYRAFAERAGIVSGGIKLAEWSLEEQLAFMSRYRIDMAILSPGNPGADVGDTDATIEVARMLNEFGAGLADGHPARFRALAALPLSGRRSGEEGLRESDISAALSELDHALGDLGMSGVMLTASTAGSYPGQPVFEPLMEALNERGAYVFIHPGTPQRGPQLNVPPYLIDFPFETTRAVVSLLYSGTLDRYPQIRFHLAHAGGTVPFLAERISLLAQHPDFKANLSRPPEHYLRRLYYDTAMASGENVLQMTLDLVGEKQVIFGTDYPYTEPDLSPPPRAQPSVAALPSETRRLIESENVLELAAA